MPSFRQVTTRTASSSSSKYVVQEPELTTYAMKEVKGSSTGSAPPLKRLVAARQKLTKRKASAGVHCAGAIVQFCTPIIFIYFCIRMITAGNVDVASSILVTIFPLLSAVFCCTLGCCKPSCCAGSMMGCAVTCVCALLALLNQGQAVHVDGRFNATKRIAVVGGGPSGSTAAWILALNNPEAVIDLYEYNPRFGGHSDTVVVEGGIPIDIGFIFSTPLYTMYLLPQNGPLSLFASSSSLLSFLMHCCPLQYALSLSLSLSLSSHALVPSPRSLRSGTMPSAITSTTLAPPRRSPCTITGSPRSIACRGATCRAAPEKSSLRPLAQSAPLVSRSRLTSSWPMPRRTRCVGAGERARIWR